MGYDHFALLALPENTNLTDDECDKLEHACQTARIRARACPIDARIRGLRELDDKDGLFGAVHHLTGASFGPFFELWFDDFIRELHAEIIAQGLHIDTIYIYKSEFDGELLTRIEYLHGIRTGNAIERPNLHDGAAYVYWTIDATCVKTNITILYDKNYRFDIS